MPPLRSRIAAAVAVAAVGGLTVATTLTFAAGNPKPATHGARANAKRPTVLIVPDVGGKAYVFAEGILDDAGFAWRVTGPVAGFAANTVVSQTPAAGTKVLDTGAPTIVLTLARNARYGETGTPMNAAPFAGTAVRLPGARPPAPRTHVSQPKARKHRAASPSIHERSRPKAPAKRRVSHRARRSVLAQKRPPAFTRPGAPKEPLDEMPLTERALLLRTWVAKHRHPTAANVHHWLYQHAWIVTGARFGWWHGADALRTLIAVDREVQRLWKIGNRSERVAENALAEVQTRTR